MDLQPKVELRRQHSVCQPVRSGRWRNSDISEVVGPETEVIANRSEGRLSAMSGRPS